MKKKWLEPLWNELFNKTNTCVTALGESSEDRGDLIEDTNVRLELIEQKWQWFIVLEIEIERKLSDVKNAMVTVEKTLDVRVEPTTEYLVVRIPATTSHGGVVLD